MDDQRKHFMYQVKVIISILIIHHLLLQVKILLNI